VVLDNTVALRGNNSTRGNVYKIPRVAMATTTRVEMAETPRVEMAKTPHVAMAKTPHMAMSWRGNLFFHAWQWPRLHTWQCHGVEIFFSTRGNGLSHALVLL